MTTLQDKKDKKSTLKIDELQVQSFVTELNEQERKTVRGGKWECEPLTGSSPC